MTSSKSRAIWPAEATFTIRAGAEAGAGRAGPRQREAGEVVDREAQLEAVVALHPRAAAGARTDPGVVDQHVEAPVPRAHVGGQRADLRERGEVGGDEREAAVARTRSSASAPARLVARVEEHGRALRAQPRGEREAEAVGRAGDEDRAAVEVGHARRQRSARVRAQPAVQAVPAIRPASQRA